MGSIVSNLASIGMAVGPPLVYVDQFVSILRRKSSSGFSHDICGVLIIANITRIFFWLGSHYETPLLIQSLLMTIAQILLLYVCLKYRKYEESQWPPEDEDRAGITAQQRLLNSLSAGGPAMKRPFNFWQWKMFGTYLEFIAAQILVLGVLVLLLQPVAGFWEFVGLFALGLESTLPIPQLLVNHRRKSLAGFRYTVLAGWLAGDTFKTIYFFVKEGNGWQFRLCAVFQLSIDCLIAVQAYMSRHNTRLEEQIPVTGLQEEAASLAREARHDLEHA